jgi:hypothetical protein
LLTNLHMYIMLQPIEYNYACFLASSFAGDIVDEGICD